jgi:DNA polymerase-4
MNSFFASCEEINHPEYQGKPLAVSGKTKRSVVCSANYLARGFGVKAAMPIYMAQKLCRGLVVIVPHFGLYHHYSNLFVDVIQTHFTNIIEMGSIDECYADITSLVNTKNDPISIAKKIQIIIKREVGLGCSIGVANNKFLAKMGSEYKKPMGITTM